MTKITFIGAGSTDTGVHALEMYFHMDYNYIDNIELLLYNFNKSFAAKFILCKRFKFFSSFIFFSNILLFSNIVETGILSS